MCPAVRGPDGGKGVSGSLHKLPETPFLGGWRDAVIPADQLAAPMMTSPFCWLPVSGATLSVVMEALVSPEAAEDPAPPPAPAPSTPARPPWTPPPPAPPAQPSAESDANHAVEPVAPREAGGGPDPFRLAFCPGPE